MKDNPVSEAVTDPKTGRVSIFRIIIIIIIVYIVFSLVLYLLGDVLGWKLGSLDFIRGINEGIIEEIIGREIE